MRAPKATITQRVLDSALTFAPSLSRQEPSIPWLHAWPLLALVRGCVLHPGVLRSCLVPTPPCSEWLFPAGERKLLVPLADTAPGTRSVFFPAGQFWPRSWRETTRLQVYMRLDPGGHLCRPRWLPVAVPTADSDVHAARQPPGSRKLNDSCALTTCPANVPSGLLNTSYR